MALDSKFVTVKYIDFEFHKFFISYILQALSTVIIYNLMIEMQIFVHTNQDFHWQIIKPIGPIFALPFILAGEMPTNGLGEKVRKTDVINLTAESDEDLDRSKQKGFR